MLLLRIIIYAITLCLAHWYSIFDNFIIPDKDNVVMKISELNHPNFH